MTTLPLPPPQKGLFIVFEGIDGSGKSTAAKYFHNKLVQLGVDAVLTREIGGVTDSGAQLRKIIYGTPENEVIDPTARVLMMYAARIQNIRNTIWPAVSAGKVVVCDRWADSTHVYQGKIDGLIDLVNGVESLPSLEYLAYRPDMLVFLDISAETSIARGKERVTPDNDLYKNNLERTQKVTHHYRTRMELMAKNRREPIFRIDAEFPLNVVNHQLDDFAFMVYEQIHGTNTVKKVA